MKTVKTSIGTVRRNTVKARLILFSVLAIALIVCSFFSEYLTPYDPYLQNLDIAKQAPTKALPRFCWWPSSRPLARRWA